MKTGDYVQVREPTVLSKKSKYAYEYVGRVVNFGHSKDTGPWTVVSVEFEGEDGSKRVFSEKFSSLTVVTPLHALADAAE